MDSRSVRRTALLALAAGAATASRRRTGPVDTRDLTGRTAVVTGGASGIGRSLAVLLAQRGATVHVADVDPGGAAAVVAQLGGAARAHTVDVADPDAVQRLADDVGPVDLLCNNAGIGHGGSIADTTLEDWRRLLDVNLMGVVHGLHAFLPRMVAQGRPGHVLNTASMAGLVTAPGLAAYSATKAAVVSLTEALDLELRGTGLRASALCPGVIDTAIVRTSTMRGEYADRRERAVQLYATRGTSPDVVARQALDGMARGRVIIPTPRYQVVPPWLLTRLSPDAGRALSAVTARALDGRP